MDCNGWSIWKKARRQLLFAIVPLVVVLATVLQGSPVQHTEALAQSDDATGNALFQAAPFAEDDNDSSENDPTIVRSRLVTINFGVAVEDKVSGGQPPTTSERLLLNLFTDTTFVAVRERVEYRSDTSFTWIGTIENEPASSVTLVFRDGTLVGNISLADGFYQIRTVTTPTHRISQVDPSEFPPEEPPLEVSASVGDVPAAPDITASDDGSIIDVMVVYTPAARAAEGSTTAMHTLIDLIVAETNTGYANSGINQRINLVHAAEISYNESAYDSSTTLRHLTYTSDGYIDSVHSWRDTYYADMVVFITETSAYCGSAWVLTTTSFDFASNAFSVVSRSCASGNLTVAHEMGHNQGAQHDQSNASTPIIYDYAYGYVAPDYAFRTVMAYFNTCPNYSCPRVNYWSNPDVVYNGQATGVYYLSSNAADNRRTLNNTAIYAANWRDSSQAAPTAPSNLNVTTVSPNQATLTWTDNSNNESGFEIERALSGSGNWSTIATVSANIESFSSNGLDCGTSYDYRIRAYNSSTSSSYSNTSSATTDACTPTTYSIEGYVTDAVGNSISGVTVDFGGSRPVVTTDASGYYSQSGFADGSYTLTASKPDCTFSPSSSTVVVPPNATQRNFTATCAPTSTRLYVDQTSTGANNGTSWSDAYTTLQDALTIATRGTEIWVAAGTYYPDEGSNQTNNDRSASFALKDGVAIYGGFAGTETQRSQRDWEANGTLLSGDIDQNDTASPVIDPANQIIGSNSYNVVRSDASMSSSAILDGFIITAGYARGSTITETRGGGIHNRSGSPRFTNITISGNTAGHSGGGIYNAYGDGLYTNITISGNSVPSGFGGGVYNKSSSPSFTNVIISGNTAYQGGGVDNFSSGNATFTNVVITGNTSRGDGSGVYNDGNTSTFTNVTISGNTATETYGEGGGIYNDSGDTTFHNSIIWGNQDSSGIGTVAASAFINGGSLTFSHSLVQGHNPTGAGNLNGTLSSNDPLFVAPVSPDDAPTISGDYRLSTGSPAVDAGDNSQVPAAVTTDLDGNQRIANGIVNLGAYETVVASSALPGDCNDDGAVNAADISALVLRLFDPAQHDNPGCDANSDGVVSAADVSAIVILINGGTVGDLAADAEVGLTAVEQVRLTMGTVIPAEDGSRSLPLILESGETVSSLFFSIDYDEQWYTFDPTDHDDDGIPDALHLTLPEGFSAMVQVDATDTDGEVDILIADVSYPLTAVPDGALATLTLEEVAAPPTDSIAATIGSSPAASFGNTSGQSIAGRTDNMQTTAQDREIYLPIIVR